MMMPSVLGENLFDYFMEDFGFSVFPDVEKALYGKHTKNMMKTDVKETDAGYEIDIDLPGFKKEEIKMQLDNGYLTVSAEKGLDKEEKNEEGRYVRRERYAGSMSRSFYVGGNVAENDIHPRYENGILTFRIPKEDKKALEEKKYITIEGE